MPASKRPNWAILSLAAAAAGLILIEVAPNRAGWPDSFSPIAQQRGYAVPLQTYGALNGVHWAYPAMILAAGALGLGAVAWRLMRPRLTDGYARRTRTLPRYERLAVAFSLLLVVLMVWIVGTAKIPLLDWTQLPPPVVVIQSLGLVPPGHESSLLTVLLEACTKTLLGLLLATIVAWPLAETIGLRLGRSRIAGSIVSPFAYGISALPPIVLFLVVSHFLSPNVLGDLLARVGLLTRAEAIANLRDLEWLGNVLLAAWAVAWPIFAAAWASAESADERLLATGAQLGADERILRRKIIRPIGRKNIYASVETGLSIGLIILLYAEGRSGVGNIAYRLNALFYPNLGQLIEDSYEDRRFADLLCVVAFSMLLALLLKAALRTLLFLRAPWLMRKPASITHLQSPEDGAISTSATPSFAGLKRYYEALNEAHRNSAAGEEEMIVLKDIEAEYGTFVLRVNALTIRKGTSTTIIGENGAGKTSLVELVAGLRVQDRVRGQLKIGGRTILDNERWVASSAGLNVGVVHQDFSLLPTMTIRENLCFGMDMRLRREPPEQRRRLRALAESAIKEIVEFLLLEDDHLLSRYPGELSRGQQQRVVIGRALLSANEVLVVDEGFASIDQLWRRKLSSGLRAIAMELGLTTLFVSHDDPREFDQAATIIQMASRYQAGRLVGGIVQKFAPGEVVNASGLRLTTRSTEERDGRSTRDTVRG